MGLRAPVVVGSVLFLVLVGCERVPREAADLVLVGGVIWTGDPAVPRAEAVAVRAGRIAAVGSDEEARTLVGPRTRVIELAGRMVMPGIIDSHTHFIRGGFQLSSVDLRDADTPEEFVRRIAAFARGLEPGQWITGGDWDHERWDGELPRRDWIDSVTEKNPVLVKRLDGHMALANGVALTLAGVTAATADPPGGAIVRRPGSPEPAGVVKDDAMDLVYRVIPPPSEAEQDAALQAAIRHAAARGVTQIHDMGTWADLEAYRRAVARGALSIRVYAVVPLATWERLRDYVSEQGRGDDRLWWGGLKGFVDGSLGSTTAWFHDPYTDAPGTSGLVTADTAELRRWIHDADAAGLHVIVHAIGDRANDWLLDVFEETQVANGPRDRRLRVEHAQHLTSDAIPRFAALDVIASMQPYHAIDDGRWAEKRIGPERIKTTYAFRSLLEAGARLAFGSDWTVAPIAALRGIYAAVTRRTLDDANPDGWVPEQRISVEDALRAYTAGSAYAGFRDSVLGTLERGKYADLVVLSRDLLTMNPVEIPEVEVQLTLVEGNVVYQAEGTADSR
ncbi:MAG: amidohydrolase [Gemmatimonadetes bacterium]|nr:amidohydrolase [Gemmatimonadota bacterium]